MWDNPGTGVAFVLLMILGGMFLGAGVAFFLAHRQVKRDNALRTAYYTRPLDDFRTFEQWCKDEKKSRWKS